MCVGAGMGVMLKYFLDRPKQEERLIEAKVHTELQKLLVEVQNGKA